MLFAELPDLLSDFPATQVPAIQVDNATCHRTQVMAQTIQSSSFSRTNFPSHSTVYDLIENIWKQMQLELKKYNYPVLNQIELSKRTLEKKLTIGTAFP